ncbi:Predicted lipid carrier protein YhbT, contains SCP2 domain [Cohaesibacter sp. ES.047]|uniref:ubiquinone anaerobic biosynthesis accessory factor UbiT n=1 Tax=Cohaesibacter sp. ES.047 TaxID=1798205 RepID=UPI000BC03F1E|nr:SCP2 sterol-binding domain-containing protein [Cohaesibacter sp. ES.047]SNY93887.1 Predicted lipid carrier protein YhbT, contains SCP2 domain [Cohaesibacter sp. ES.047]
MTEGTVRNFPPVVARLTQFLPLVPLERLIATAADRVATQHPEFFDRLGDYADKSFVVVPTDLDWVARITFYDGRVQIRLSRSIESFANRDVTVTAPFLSLLNLLDGKEDGDALFFSRDLSIEGDTEAVLALRNALDDAEIDFIHECASIAGPFSQPLETGGKTLLDALRNSSFTRSSGPAHADAASAPMPGAYPT